MGFVEWLENVSASQVPMVEEIHGEMMNIKHQISGLKNFLDDITFRVQNVESLPPVMQRRQDQMTIEVIEFLLCLAQFLVFCNFFLLNVRRHYSLTAGLVHNSD